MHDGDVISVGAAGGEEGQGGPPVVLVGPKERLHETYCNSSSNGSNGQRASADIDCLPLAPGVVVVRDRSWRYADEDGGA
eukprot:46441-Eustigmatos_ZCMA.PRE.1